MPHAHRSSIATSRWLRAARIVVFALWGSFLGPTLLAQSEPAGTSPAADTSRPIVAQKNLVIRKIAGTTIRADLFRPDDAQIYPLVMMIHGGAWSAGDKWDLIDHAREVAQAGFVAVTINYRLAPKFPIDDQLDDCRHAMQWAQQESKGWRADAERFCLWGYSAGAHLASMLALKPSQESPQVRAVVAGGAPCEFSFVPLNSRLLAHVMGGSRAEEPEKYRQVSPIEYASAEAPPFFFFHGTSDFLVPRSSSRALADKLQALSIPTEYYQVEGRGHLLTFLDLQARQRAVTFLQKHVQDAR